MEPILAEPSSQENVSVKVIPPEYSEQEVQGKGLDIVSPIYYPYLIFQLQAIFRRFGQPKKISHIFAVDLSRNIALKADSFPAPEKRSAPKEHIIPQELPDELGYKMAKRKFLHILMRKMLFFKAPEFHVLDHLKAYKVFWMARNAQAEFFIINSLTGETEVIDRHQAVENPV